MTITLREHQAVDLQHMRDASYYALWHEVGAGKTFPFAFRMLEDLMMNPGGTWVVLAEAGNLLVQLKEEILRCNAGAIPDLDIAVLTGSAKAHEKQRVKMHTPDIIIINYEYFPRWEAYFYSLAMSGRLRGMIFDEAHRMKGFRGMRSKYGKRTKSIVKVAHARYGQPNDIKRYLASGSPIVSPDSPDVWALYYVMDPEIMGRTLWRFESEFFYDIAVGQPFKNLKLKPGMKEELSRRMYGGDRFTGTRARRLLLNELGNDVPDDVWMQYPVQMSPMLRKKYNELQQEAVTEVEGQQVSRPEVLARLMALQQLSGGFLIEREQQLLDRLDFFSDDFDVETGECERRILHIDPSHKDRQLWRIIDEIGRDTPVIIWAHFKHELAHIAKMFEDEGMSCALAYGDVSQRAKIEGIQAFKAGDLKRLIAQPASAGAGLNLQIAGHSIRYGRSHRLLDYIQSNGRIRRPGSAHDRVVYHEIYVEDSSDEHVYRSLKDKQALSSELTLDHLRRISR